MSLEQGANRSDARVRPSYMAHFVVRTSKFEECVSFYRALFDADDVFVNDNIAFLTFDDEHHRVAIVRMPGLEAFSASIAGVDHVAFTMHGLRSLLENFERLKQLDIVPVRVINHGPTMSFYYVDPNGSRIELQVDNISLSEGPGSYFRTSDFAANPSGVEVDPEDLMSGLRAGRSEEELLRVPAFIPTDDARSAQPG